MTPPLDVRDLTLRFGAITAFEGVSFDVAPRRAVRRHRPQRRRQELAVQRAVARLRAGRRQRAARRPRLPARCGRDRLAGLGVARSFQNLGVFPHLTALENVLVGRHHLMRCGVLRGGLGLGAREERRHREAAMEALEFVGLADHAGTEVQLLPYGHRKRVELARCLAMEPRLMLLDEPVAGMNAAERAEITALVRRLRASAS